MTFNLFKTKVCLNKSTLAFLGTYIALSLFQKDYVSIAVILSLYFIVLLHEFGHVFAAKMYGYRCDNITIYFLGGVASIEMHNETPKEQFIVTIAGPMVNIILALFCLPYILLTGNIDGHNYVTSMFTVNVFMTLFNLIPAYPLDGGRILNSFIRTVIKNEKTAKKLTYHIAAVMFIAILILAWPMKSLIMGIISLMGFYYLYQTKDA